MNLLSYIDGLVLGDGSIVPQSNGRGYFYSQVCIYKEWLEKIGGDFAFNGLTYTIYNEKKSEWGVNEKYKIRSFNTSFFIDIRNRWYKQTYYNDKEGYECSNTKKIVPKDIELTPECVANWYMGDGSLRKQKNRPDSYDIRIATDGFTIEEVNFLAFSLGEQVVENVCTEKHGGGSIIRISRKQSVNSFIEYILPYMTPCFYYKIKEEFL